MPKNSSNKIPEAKRFKLSTLSNLSEDGRKRALSHVARSAAGMYVGPTPSRAQMLSTVKLPEERKVCQTLTGS